MNTRASRCRRLAMAITLLTLAALVLPSGRAAADDFEESRSPWAVQPPIGQNDQPGVERDGTLRIIRFSNDRQLLNDPGTVLGFVSIFARTGTLSPTHEKPSDEKSLLEIMRRGELRRE
jgi:hypothetical protein